MPEVYIPSPFIDQLKRQRALPKYAKKPRLYQQAPRVAIQFPNEEFIAAGSENVVLGYPNTSDIERSKVIAYDFSEAGAYSSIRFSALYHTHRILSILRPTNFPRFYATARGEHAGSVRQRVPLQTELPAIDPGMTLEQYERKLMEVAFNHNAIIGNALSPFNIHLLLDIHFDNFATNNDDPMYLDSVSNYSGMKMNIDTIIQTLNERQKQRAAGMQIPLADGIINERHAFLSSARRIREFDLLGSHMAFRTKPTFNEVEEELADIIAHIDFANDDERIKYVESSRLRINRYLEQYK